MWKWSTVCSFDIKKPSSVRLDLDKSPSSLLMLPPVLEDSVLPFKKYSLPAPLLYAATTHRASACRKQSPQISPSDLFRLISDVSWGGHVTAVLAEWPGVTWPAWTDLKKGTYTLRFQQTPTLCVMAAYRKEIGWQWFFVNSLLCYSLRQEGGAEMAHTQELTSREGGGQRGGVDDRGM